MRSNFSNDLIKIKNRNKKFDLKYSLVKENLSNKCIKLHNKRLIFYTYFYLYNQADKIVTLALQY